MPNPLRVRQSAKLFALVIACAPVLLIAATASAIVSDDFSSPTLNTSLWTVTDPVGDATVKLSGTNLLIDIPGGADHDAWSTCNCAPRIMQTTADSDFEIEVKFDSIIEERYQVQGIMVAESLDSYLRFDVYHNGSSPVVFAAYVNGTAAGSFLNVPVAQTPSYMQVERTGDSWELRYSNDGTNWIVAGSFTRVISVSETGFFVGTTRPNALTPPMIANVDYFFNTASPIVPEDGGAATAPSLPNIEVWYGDNQDFGHLGNPQTLIQVQGRTWDTDPMASMSFRLNGGASQPLNVGPDGLRLVRRGEYTIEIDNGDLLAGANTLEITAIDTLGEQSDTTITLNYTAAQSWALPATIDWGSAAEIQDVAQIVDGLWHLDGNSGVRTDSSGIGYDRLLVAGETTWSTDYEVLLPFTIHRMLGPIGVGLAFGWQGHTGSEQPKLGHPYQAIGWIDGGPAAQTMQLLRNGDVVLQSQGASIDLNTRYLMRMRSQDIGGGLSDVRLKVWEDGTPEPPGWNMSDTFTTLDGSVLLIAHLADVTFGDVTITPLSAFPQYDVTVNAVGNGSVGVSPPGLTYPQGTSVVFTATPDPGWTFDNWSDGLTGSQSPDTIVSLESDTTVTANFSQDQYTFTVSVPGGGGTVTATPDQATYVYGDTVILTAFPDGGNILQGWSGDLTGKENPDTVVVVANTNITATFGPLVYNLDVIIDGMGSVAKAPDKTQYNPGETVILTAIPDPNWLFSGWTQGLSGQENPDTVIVNSDTTVTARFSFDSMIVSDDFDSTALDTALWTVVDPVGDANIVMTGTNLLIDIPGGMNHDLWSTCNCAPRVVQPANDADFELELKLDSGLDRKFQLQGFLIGEDSDSFLRLDTHWTGTSHVLLAAYINNGGASLITSTTIPGAPAYLQVERTGDDWEYRYSYDGANWVIGASFTRVLAVTEVGFFIGSAAAQNPSTPPMVGNIDYFMNIAEPIIPEDGGQPTAVSAPNIEVWYGDDQDFGHLGNPQTLIQVMGRVWDTDDMGAMSYKLNGGPSMPLTVGDDGFRLVRRGEYNIEIDNSELLIGANTLEITAVDTLGEQSDTTITINYTGGQAWSLPYTIDWGAATRIQDVAQVVDGLWHLDGGDVRTDSAATGYDRLLVAGETSWMTDYEVVLPLTIHRGYGPGGIGIAIGWQGHTGAAQPKLGHPYQALGWIANFPNNTELELLGNGDIVYQEMSTTLTTNTRYIMKLRSESVGGGQSDVKMKLWEQGMSEPVSWDLEDIFTTLNGSVLLVAHLADVSFGAATITPLNGVSSHVLTTNAIGSGTVLRSPNLALYPDSTDVELTAVPSPGWSFDSWSAGLTGNANPDSILVVSDTTVTATFTANAYTLTLNTVGDGSIQKVPDQPTYAFGDSVFLTAVPGPGASFFSWSDGLTGSENPDTVVIASDSTVTATFTANAYTLTLNAVGNGSIQKMPDKPAYVYGDTVLVMATPDPGWSFTTWSDGLSGSENPDTVVVASDSTVTATFTANAYTLTLNTVGDGSIQKVPDQPTYAFGDSVFLTAVPGPGSSFFSWSDGLTGSENPDTVVIASDSTVTATFTANAYTLTLNAVGNGSIQKMPDKPAYVYGDTVLVMATPDPGWSFTTWSDGLSGSENPDTVVVASDSTVTANFASNAYTLTLNTVGNGSIQKVPDQPTYAFGDSVFLTAVPGPGASFDSWSDGLSGSENPDTVVIASDSTVTANFASNAYTLTLNTVGNGSIQKVPDQPTYAFGDSVFLTAVPGPGASFDSWSDGLSGSENPDTVVIASDSTVTANFASNAYTLTLNTVGNGSIQKVPDQPTYAFGDSVFLTAVPGPGSSFDSWSDGLTGSENPDTVVIASDSTVTATFTANAFTLTLNAVGDGSIQKVPDQPTYAFGDSVFLTAVPGPGASFGAWSDGLTGSENPDTVVIASDSTVTANFTSDAYTLTLNTVGDGSIQKVPDQPTYAFGDSVFLTAVPDPGWSFTVWSDGLTGSENPDTIVVASDSTITATFVDDMYALTIDVVGNGSVQKTPNQPGYSLGDTVIVVAVPDSSWTFDSWSGDLTSSENPDTIVIGGPTNVTATFGNPTGIGDLPPVASLIVRQNFPNPFREGTNITFGVPEGGEVRIEVFDVAGRRVFQTRTPAVAGWNQWTFSGRNTQGSRLATGVYFYRIRAAGQTVTQKMVITR